MGRRTVAIIGSGFSGTVVAIHLLRAAPAGLDRLYLVERVEGHVGGVAYRTQSASHTLNVPAGRMSAFEDDPDGFLRFVRRREPALTGGSFVPRREYGEYLAETLDDARRSSPLPLLRVTGEVVSVSESGDDLILGLATGEASRPNVSSSRSGTTRRPTLRSATARCSGASVTRATRGRATRSSSTAATTCSSSAPG